MIDGVKIVPLRQIVDERGKIMHMLKATDPHFIAFGEIYFSCAWPGTDQGLAHPPDDDVNNAVLSGRAKLVMYDLREDSPTQGRAAGGLLRRGQLLPRPDPARHRQRLQGLRRQDGDPGQLRHRAARPGRDAADRSVHATRSLRLGAAAWLSRDRAEPGDDRHPDAAARQLRRRRHRPAGVLRAASTAPCSARRSTSTSTSRSSATASSSTSRSG